MSEQEKEQLAKVIAELICTNSEIQSAVLDLVCSCPNVMVQY